MLLKLIYMRFILLFVLEQKGVQPAEILLVGKPFSKQ